MKRGCYIAFLVATMAMLCSAFGGDEFDDFADELEAEFDGSSPAPEHDPLRYLNRGIYHFNDRLYVWVLDPTATAYSKIIPETVRYGVSRFLRNLSFPSRLVNSALQGKLSAAGNECTRFAVNTTVGILGVRDPALSWLGIKESQEDFGQTLGHYGVGAGIPIMVPIFGPSNARDAAGLFVDYFLDPVSYIDSTKVRMAIKGTAQFNNVSLHLGEYGKLKEGSLDPYMLFISAYNQLRNDKIKK